MFEQYRLLSWTFKKLLVRCYVHATVYIFKAVIVERFSIVNSVL